MASINTGRVIVGGLVAGLVYNIGETILNVPLLGDRLASELAAHNFPPIAGPAIGIFVVMCFALGIVTVWIYAAIRPRFGPGPGTAACAGLIVWSLAFLWAGVATATMGFFSWGLMTMSIVWQAVESVVAAVAGAYLYKE